MNNREFIKILQNDDKFRKRVRQFVLSEMQGTAAREEVKINDVPKDTMEQLASSFVERGLHEKP